MNEQANNSSDSKDAGDKQQAQQIATLQVQ
jgi:hypothetical protein